MIIICPKNGQFEKELDFKSLLGRLICFMHRFSTKAVENYFPPPLGMEKSEQILLGLSE